MGMDLGARRIDSRSLSAAFALLLLLLALALLRSGPVESLPAIDGGDAASERIVAPQSYAALPLAFEPNAGRYPRPLDFVSSSQGGTIALGESGAILTPEAEGADPIRMSLAGASAEAPIAIDRLPGVVNDLRGEDRHEWVTEIPTFSRVRYASVYPGIDLDYHGSSGTLEYDFRLAAGANPDRIAIGFGEAPLRIAANGKLVIGAGPSRIRQAAPIAYQPTAEGRTPVVSRFTLDHQGMVGFELGDYDQMQPLVIDPLVLDYSTYLGGDSTDGPTWIAVDSSGSAYVAGSTSSTDFNTQGQIEGDAAVSDVFISKLNPAGSALVYSTYLGGNSDDLANSIAVDSSGSAYVAGSTDSGDFNTQGQIEGDSASTDAFISKLNPAGNALTYSTYLGGNGSDIANSIALDSSGSAYVTGFTASSDFDTQGPIEGDSTGLDAFISKLNPAGNALTYSTYLGGGSTDIANSIAVDSAGSAYLAGQTASSDFDTQGPIEGDSTGIDAFISKLNPAGGALTYSTYLGGGSTDIALSIAVDSSGSAYVAGSTSSTDFNTQSPIEGDSAADDAFISKLNPTGGAVTYSTYLGGGSADIANSIAVDSVGSANVAGQTASSDFDTQGPIEGDSASGDAFISKLNPAGSALTDSTYLGGNSDDIATSIALDPSGSAYVAGYTSSSDFNTQGPIEGDSAGVDAFITKLDPPPNTSITSGPADGSTIGDSTPTFGLSSSEPASTFQCRIDGGAFAPCSSPYTTPTLGDGPHVFEVRAIDNGSNPDDTPAPRSFTVDATAPETQIDTGPAGTTDDATPTFGFSSPAPDTSGFECRTDGGPFSSCTSPSTLAALNSGDHTFEVRAIDAAGNTDASPATRSFSVVASSDDACAKAKAKLKKAKAKLKKAKTSGSAAKVKKAKSAVKKAKSAVKKAC